MRTNSTFIFIGEDNYTILDRIQKLYQEMVFRKNKIYYRKYFLINNSYIYTNFCRKTGFKGEIPSISNKETR